MNNLTDKTLYLFVNCCVEKSRFDVAKQVIDTLNAEQARIDMSIVDDLIVFDNGSTYEGSIEMLRDGFKGAKIFRSRTNEGYWSAIDWVLQNYKNIVPEIHKYSFVHVIESDHTYFALDRLRVAETTLMRNFKIGSVRLQEYSVKDKPLYDKTLNLSNGRRYAWVSHVNHVTGASIELVKLYNDDGIGVWSTNFLTCLHSLNRIGCLSTVFNALREKDTFTEHEFQKLYLEETNRRETGLIDGGVFHAKLGFTLDSPDVLSGSWSHDQEAKGYMTTRVDKIRPYTNVELIA